MNRANIFDNAYIGPGLKLQTTCKLRINIYQANFFKRKYNNYSLNQLLLYYIIISISAYIYTKRKKNGIPIHWLHIRTIMHTKCNCIHSKHKYHNHKYPDFYNIKYHHTQTYSNFLDNRPGTRFLNLSIIYYYIIFMVNAIYDGSWCYERVLLLIMPE